MTTPTDPVIDATLNAPPGGPPGAPAAVVAPTPEAPDILTPAANTPPATVESDDANVIQYEKTGDVALDLSLEFFGKLGLGLDSPELDQAGKGNFQYLEAKLASLGDKAKGSEQFVALAKEAYTRLEAKSKEQFAGLQKTVYDAVGGETTWAAVQQFAKSNLKPEQLAEVRTTLNAGGIGAAAMAQYLHRQALNASGTTIPGNTAVDTSVNPTATLTNLAPLAPEAWRAEYKAGIAKHGITGFAKTPEYAALVQRYRKQ